MLNVFVSQDNTNNLLQIFKWPTKTLPVITIDIVVDLPVNILIRSAFYYTYQKKKKDNCVNFFHYKQKNDKVLP